MTRVSKKLQEIKEVMEVDFINEETILDELEELERDTEFILKLKEEAIHITEEREIGKVLHNIEEVLLCVTFAILAKCNTFIYGRTLQMAR